MISSVIFKQTVQINQLLLRIYLTVYMKNFDIISQLGTGSFGKVHLATHLGTGEKVAIKTISKSKLKTKQDFQMVNKQIAVFKTVQHPNIIKLYEIFQDETCLYLVMEHADGDLLTYIKDNGTLSQHLALVYMRQLSEAIKYLHSEKNIAHRDIKLANILLCSKHNCIKLADFGLSNFYQKDQQLKTSCGSPCYSAPQILIGARYNPLHADIWSLGVVFYSMIQGCLPFYNQNSKQLYKQVIKGKYCQHEKASKQVQQVIKKILQINPECRIGINELILQINKILNQKNQQIMISTSVPKLSKESHDYVESLKNQNIRKFLSFKGFEESIISGAYQYRRKYMKPRKFDQINTYIELLDTVPINRLSAMLQKLINQSKIQKTELQQSHLKRNYSSFTRDTLKSSQAEQKHQLKIRFVRNGVVKQKNTKLGESQVTKKPNIKVEQIKKAPIAKHQRKRSDLLMSLSIPQPTSQAQNKTTPTTKQLKYGYIKLTNRQSLQPTPSQPHQLLSQRQPRQKNQHLSLSLTKQSIYEQSSTITSTRANQSINYHEGITTQRSHTFTHTYEYNDQIPTYKGLFNIMHTFNGDVDHGVLVDKIRGKFEVFEVVGSYRYEVRDSQGEKYEVEILKIQGFRCLKLIRISPKFNPEILQKIKTALHQSQIKSR